MGDGFQYGDLIFLGLIALFIGLRLRSMLGKEQGMDPREAWKQATREALQERVAQAADRSTKAQKQEESAFYERLEGNTVLADGLKSISQADPLFSPTEFVAGAKLAFEWVVTSFSKGQKDKLKALLSEERYRIFAAEIDAAAQSETMHETTLVAIDAADITEAVLRNGKAYVTVQFTSEQIHVERDKEKNIISGDPSDVVKVVDVWTFERDPSSRDPNWKIIVT